MLPIFLDDQQDLVEVMLELDDASNNIVVRSVTPTRGSGDGQAERSADLLRVLERNLSVTSRIRREFPWLSSPVGGSSSSGVEADHRDCGTMMNTRDAGRMRARLDRSKSSAQRALKGLRFISKTTATKAGQVANEDDREELWRKVEKRFDGLAKDGLLSREDFGECIGKLKH